MSEAKVTFNGETTTAITVDGYTLELKPDPDMHVSKIRAGAEEIELFERRILGRAEGLNDDFDSASVEFTDVIKWDIITESAFQTDVWMKVGESLRFCAGVTEEWADTLSEYKQERRRIIKRWNEEAGALEEDLNHTPLLDFVAFEQKHDRAATEIRRLKEDLETEESEAHQHLSTKATDARSELAYGATPEAVQRLIDGGYFNWAYFNLGGDLEAVPNDMEGDEAAEELADFAGDPEDYDGDMPAVVAILNNMALRSADKKDNSEEFNDREVEFLEDFYSELERLGDENQQPPGVLNIANQISLSEDIDKNDVKLILGALGGGVLILSDENVNGGYEKLPPSVQEASEGQPEGSPGVGSWHSDISTLAQMFENTDENVQGGERLSVNLMHSMGHMLDEVGSPEGLSIRFEDIETIVDTSTRNENANLEILTHEKLRPEGDSGNSDYSRDNETTLRGLLTFDWEDDGEALSGLTDWIWEQHDGSSGAEQERALEGLIGLVTSLGEDSDTFLDVETDGSDTNIPPTVAQLNPELAESWTKIFSVYVDHFAESSGSDTDDLFEATSKTAMFDEGDLVASMSPSNRKDFLQLLVSEESTESHVLLSAIDYEHRNLDEAIFGGSGEPEDYANPAGRLRGWINGAIMEEYESRNKEAVNLTEKAQKEAAAKWEAAYSIGKDLLGTGLSSVPVAGTALSEGLSMATTIFDEDVKEYIADRVEDEVNAKREKLEGEVEMLEGGEYREDQAQWNIQLQIAHMLMGKGMISEEDFDPDVLVEGALPMSQMEWELDHTPNARSVLNTARDSLAEHDSATPVDDLLEEYIEQYVRSFDPVS